ncbi:MAG: ABC transporter ATP-binding protein [Candidatus Methylacidiphilales bacterium]
MNKIQLKGISKYTLTGMDLDVREGEILTLLGSSGSGKSTLLRLIAGIERPDRGQIFIDGKMVCGDECFVAPEKRRIGVVFQNFALFPHLTVRENVTFGLSKRSSVSARERYRQLETMLELEGLEGRYPHQISGGQQQRVAVARAMAPEPSILLFDEPFSNLDEYLRENVRRDIRSLLKDHGLTSIFVSHDKKDALSISDRIAVINNGIVEQVDTPEMIYTSPRTRYIAEYFGKTNLIEASASQGGFDTPYGFLPHHHDEQPGVSGCLSVRPHWCVVDLEHPFIKGEVSHVVDYGECKEVTLRTRQNHDIFIHLHHHEPVHPGHEIGVHVEAPRLKIMTR